MRVNLIIYNDLDLFCKIFRGKYLFPENVERWKKIRDFDIRINKSIIVANLVPRKDLSKWKTNLRYD